MLPDIDGREFAGQFRRSHPGTKVLFTSGDRDDPAGGESFLQKPFTPGQLARTVRAVLDERPG